MGLGKTISAIGLMTSLYTTHWESFSNDIMNGSGFGPFLIVCPATVINQWVQELKVWTSSLPKKLEIFTFSSSENTGTGSKKKTLVIKDAFNTQGVVITSYEFLRSEAKLF